MRRVVVDTSVFVEFFRGRRVPHFEDLLRANAILLSPCVRLELLMGVRRSESARLDHVLGGIPGFPHRAEVVSVAERFVERLKGKGISVGLVDLLIAAEASLLGSPVFSFDSVFGRLARLGLVKLFSS